MMTWEYMRSRILDTDAMNAFGLEGWELFAITDDPPFPCWWKRRKS
jgi:hypothetical protein